MHDTLLMIPAGEAALRLEKVKARMKAENIEHIIVRDTANIFYLTGRVFDGFIYINASGNPTYFVRRPNTIHHCKDVVAVTKPESMPEHIDVPHGSEIGLELDSLTYTMATRIMKAFNAKAVNASAVMRKARSVKTGMELEMLREDGIKHDHVYSKIPSLFREGMTDIELQVEIERTSRLEGCLGQFRTAGDVMEIHMANILAGDNADAASPYDFAMGGQGMNPSLPVGANGTVIRPGLSVMVDANGNFNGYMTDMTRTFACTGDLSEKALKAHQCSIDICRALEKSGRPGAEARALYEEAASIARAAGLEDYFMGHSQHAGFVGHGVGIEINELPVIAPKSRDILETGNVIALEPKFVIPGTGAVGIENTYAVTANGLEALTHSPEQITVFLP